MVNKDYTKGHAFEHLGKMWMQAESKVKPEESDD